MFVRFEYIIFLTINFISCIHSFKMIEVEKILNQVNSVPNSSWKAGINYNISFLKNPSRLMGVLPRNKLKENHAFIEYELINRSPLPESYNVALKWHECTSVVSIRDQSNCGSCWAISTASAFGDRLCIASDTSINKVLSGEYINSCCKGNGCNGGLPEDAWRFIKTKGVCTGGEYGSNMGCQPYSIVPCLRDQHSCFEENEATPQCFKDKCTNSNYELPLPSDLYYADTVYNVRPKMKSIMHDIYIHGPVVAAMQVFDDFLHYKGGIYQYTTGELKGEHAVKLMGWGRDDGIDYWLGANTWGTSWGMNGMFKIRRGKNECGIESRIITGLPKV